jgi:hypothetical protein
MALIACALFSACGDGDQAPTAPGGGGPGYAGEWSGTTAQGQPISFTVSADQKVTAVSAGYVFSGCSGMERLSNLSETIMQLSTGGFAQFGQSLADGRGISVTITFVAERSASGVVVFYGPPSCGSTGSGSQFNASKR